MITTWYLTDGVHLYEVERLVENFGLVGGEHAIVRDCKTNGTRELTTLEVAVCRQLETEQKEQT